MKQRPYFSHDEDARNDERMVRARIKHGSAGYSVYFMILEIMRKHPEYICERDYEVIAFDVREPVEVVKSVVEDFGFFQFSEDGSYFYSESFLHRMTMKDRKSENISEKRSRAAKKRWKNSKPDANAMQMDACTVQTDAKDKDKDKDKYSSSDEEESRVRAHDAGDSSSSSADLFSQEEDAASPQEGDSPDPDDTKQRLADYAAAWNEAVPEPKAFPLPEYVAAFAQAEASMGLGVFGRVMAYLAEHPKSVARIGVLNWKPVTIFTTDFAVKVLAGFYEKDRDGPLKKPPTPGSVESRPVLERMVESPKKPVDPEALEEFRQRLRKRGIPIDQLCEEPEDEKTPKPKGRKNE